MTTLTSLVFASMLWLGGDSVVRIATYNAENYKSEVAASKRDALRTVIERMDADVIGFQEVSDRAALEQILPPSEWHIIIDDDSQPQNPRWNDQDLAIAVRKPHNFRIHGSNGNARDEDFLFTDASSEFFPGRRDVLCVEVLLSGGGSVFVMNNHAKSRSGGRATTNPRREGAAIELVRRLERDFDEALVVYLGDLNDNPDDRSLNILETGDPQARASMENDPGPFMINLTEALWVDGYMTYGWYRDGEQLIYQDPEARQTQFDMRFENRMPQGREFAVILDHILVSPKLARFWVPGSTKIFADPIVADASDHLPVYADFAFFAGTQTGENSMSTVAGRLVIAALLVNPSGPDSGSETVLLRNGDSKPYALEEVTLKDRAGNEAAVSSLVDVDMLGPGKSILLNLPTQVLPLNNSGDWVGLFDKGQLIHEVAYTQEQVRQGENIIFVDRVRPPRSETRNNDLQVTYYAPAEGKSGEALKLALHEIIRDHRSYSYGEVWTILQQTDRGRENGSVAGFYSGKSIPVDLKDSGRQGQDDHWNREHIWPKSQGFKRSNAHAHNDVHHLRATDRSINHDRGNKQFAAGGAKHDECDCSFTDATWEPPQNVRGDVARMMFYMATRYEGDDGSATPDLELVKGMGRAKAGEMGDLCSLLKWHAEDPVDEEERKRNQLIFEFQGNRNPFIDRPEFAVSIWQNICNQ